MEQTEHKSQPQKSPNYPSMDLEAAISKVKVLFDKDGKVGAPKKVALAHLGYNVESGSSARTFSALRKFDLIMDVGERIVPSQRAIDIIVYPKDSEKYSNALRGAALNPKIYGTLLDKYKDGFPSDESLKAELIDQFNFNKNQVQGFLHDFRRTMEFAGVRPGEGDAPLPEGEVKMDQPNQSVQTRSGSLSVQGGKPNLLINSFPIPLRKQNMATIMFSKLPLDKADLDLLKKWIDLMQANLTEPAANDQSEG